MIYFRQNSTPITPENIKEPLVFCISGSTEMRNRQEKGGKNFTANFFTDVAYPPQYSEGTTMRKVRSNHKFREINTEEWHAELAIKL